MQYTVAILLLPFLIQGIVITFDEWYFHRKRGLPKWERIGHPLDTASVLICLLFPLLFPYTPGSLKVFIGLAIGSCLFVTKDEFVHKEHCPAMEQWVHALLFLNHPVLLTATALVWTLFDAHSTPIWLTPLLGYIAFFKTFLILQAAMAASFMFYQIIYWNFLWKKA